MKYASESNINWTGVFLLLSSIDDPGGGGATINNWRGCSSKFSKATPKSYYIGCGSSQFYSLKVTSEIFIHRNSTGILKIIANRQQVLLQKTDIDMPCLENGPKVTVLSQSANF